MIFDFETFERGVRLAYRKYNIWYEIEDVLHVFRYYFETYEFLFHKAHPLLKLNQIERIICTMPCIDDGRGSLDIDPSIYPELIDQHFATKYNRCDFNINHFFSGQIRIMRYYDVQNKYYE